MKVFRRASRWLDKITLIGVRNRVPQPQVFSFFSFPHLLSLSPPSSAMASSSTLPPSDLDECSSSDPFQTPPLPTAQNQGYIPHPDAGLSFQFRGIDLNLLQSLLAQSATPHPAPTTVFCCRVTFAFLTHMTMGVRFRKSHTLSPPSRRPQISTL